MIDSKGPVVHIIDDDESLGKAVALNLKQDGLVVTVNTDSETGYQQVRDECPDIVILDIMMPGKTGLDIMEEMRADPQTEDIPILFLTAVDDEATIVKCLRGGDDYLVKPFKALELRERVRKILERQGGRKVSEPVESVGMAGRVPVRVGNDTYLLPFKSICFLEASGKYCYAITQARRYLIDASIGDLEDKLSGLPNFVRVHRSYIVNIDFVRKLRKDSPRKTVVVMNDEEQTEIRIGDAYSSRIKKMLNI